MRVEFPPGPQTSDKSHSTCGMGTCQFGGVCMFRINVPVGGSRLEAEGDTEEELEIAAKVALRIAETRSASSNSHHEGIEKKLADSKELRVDSVRPRLEPDPGMHLSHVASVKPEETPSQRKAAPRLPPLGYAPPNYGGLSNLEQLRLALCDLKVNYKQHEPSARQILEHLEKTGGRFETNSKAPVAGVRQLLRGDKRILSTGAGWRAQEEAAEDFLVREKLWTEYPSKTNDNQKPAEPEPQKLERLDNFDYGNERRITTPHGI